MFVGVGTSPSKYSIRICCAEMVVFYKIIFDHVLLHICISRRVVRVHIKVCCLKKFFGRGGL